jgi:threonine dehydrogenase-like Zn-dependent dehydrogenase
MKAVRMHTHGGPGVLVLEDVPDPVPAAGEVLVSIRAASVNAADWKVRSGISPVTLVFPHILGRDFSGVVEAAGPGTDIAPGTEVYAVCPPGMEGGYAEKICIGAQYVARKPEKLSHVEAAAIGLAALTALVTIEDTLKLKRGEKILIQGGAGGVAGMAIQLAHHLGAEVVTTARAENHAYVLGLGADQVIDYTREDPAALLGDCDAAFDTVGGASVEQSFGWGTWIRTRTNGVRVRGSTVNLFPSAGEGASPVAKSRAARSPRRNHRVSRTPGSKPAQVLNLVPVRRPSLPPPQGRACAGRPMTFMPRSIWAPTIAACWSPADAAGSVPRGRCVFAHCPAGRGPRCHRRAVRRCDGPGRRGAEDLCRESSRAARCAGMRLIATEACRSARNGAEFLERVRETGLSSRSSTRETEARLAVAGCSSLVGRDTDGLVLFDIGGGSSEIAMIDLTKTARAGLPTTSRPGHRCPVGVVTLSERHGGCLVTPQCLRADGRGSRCHAGGLRGRAPAFRPLGDGRIHLLGTSGTVTTLAGMHLDLPRYDRRKVDGLWLSNEDVDRMLDRLLSWDFEARAANPCIGADRADLVLAGCAILQSIRKRWPSERLRVADRGLREGLLNEMMAADGAWRRAAAIRGRNPDPKEKP